MGAAQAPSSTAAFERAFRQQRRAQRLATVVGVGLFVAALAASVVVGRFDVNARIAGAPKLGEYVWRTLPELRWATLGKDLAAWFYALPKWLDLMVETVLMAYLATLLGSLGAVVLAPFASHNLAWGPVSCFLAKRLLEFCRTIPDLVFALIFVFAFGLGPLPGILAIAINDIGTLAKLFSESIENIDRKQPEGLKAVGADSLEAVRFGIVPQVLPMLMSSTLHIFESNVRSATILGVVGAGGIGFQLSDRIRAHQWEEAAFILILILATVALIDAVSRRLRGRLIG